ncbi:hypothetical protein BH23PLA1_BH23PLA1_34960 [soil metagenome]
MRSDFEFPRVQALPGIDRASLCINGVERVGYDFGLDHPRPFFYPVLGPTGHMLTRMGHPDPVGHEHHRSVWFGHQFVDDVNFWTHSPGQDVQVRHRRVVVYEDGRAWAAFAADLEWWADGTPRMKQGLIAAIEPLADNGYALDLQSRFETATGSPVELGKTNFGFLGVRLAKTVSEQFGGGRLTNAEGKLGEDAIFGQPSRWVDYSGPVAPGKVEGIAYFDHPGNPRHPTHWHVRRDGWMEAAFCLEESYGLAEGHPLDLRYRLLIHAGPADLAILDRAWKTYAELPPYRVVPRQPGDVGHIVRG